MSVKERIDGQLYGHSRDTDEQCRRLGQVVSEAEQEIVPEGSTVTEFNTRRPDGWPSREYQVTVTLNNGGTKATKTIKVL